MTNNNTKSGSSPLMAYFSGLAILFAIAAGYSIYIFLLGNPANFEDGDVAKGHPLGLLGIIYRGGIAIVPLLIAVNITVILIAIERFITLSAASGRGPPWETAGCSLGCSRRGTAAEGAADPGAHPGHRTWRFCSCPWSRRRPDPGCHTG